MAKTKKSRKKTKKKLNRYIIEDAILVILCIVLVIGVVMALKRHNDQTIDTPVQSSQPAIYD